MRQCSRPANQTTDFFQFTFTIGVLLMEIEEPIEIALFPRQLLAPGID